MRRRQSDERGVTVILLALTISMILVAAAFAVDLGYWYVRAQQVQRAADAAALAGVVWLPGDLPRATAVALEAAKANGFADGVGSITVQVARGANDRQLSVRIVDGDVARFFSGVASKDRVSIGRQGVAQYELPVPLGAPENQFGGGANGVYLAVNGFCTIRADGDPYSSAYYNTSNPRSTAGACPSPLGTPASPLAKNPSYRTSGYSYVVSIPSDPSAACAVASPAPSCSRTASPVTIELLDPTVNDRQPSPPGPPPAPAPGDDFSNIQNASGCNVPPVRLATTSFSVYGADGTPLDDSDNPLLLGPVSFSTANVTAISATDLYTVPAGSASGRYLVRVSTPDERCSRWSNGFGIRARVGATFLSCSTIPTAPPTPLPAGYGFCPQVYGLDAMSLRVVVAGASLACAPGATKEVGTNRCSSFYLAQVDPTYAGRQMVISLFDPGEGARRLRVLAPGGTPVGFTWRTADGGTSRSGTAPADVGLDVSAPLIPPTPASCLPLNPALPVDPKCFDDRKLELTVDLPDQAALSTGGGWFKMEYEVDATGSLTDRTTWGVTVRGAPVRLVT